MNVTSNKSKISLHEPDFGSKLTDLIIELDYIRKKPLGGSTHPEVFFQLKSIFHMLESIGSSRIEGNHTTVADYVEKKIEGKRFKDEKDIEIQNLEKAMAFIDKNIESQSINRVFLSELHKLVVKDLTPRPEGEGSRCPGEYRMENVTISKSKLIPPDFTQVISYMDDLFLFINNEDPAKYDLLKVAIAHHQFAWIHPFDNGNGRTVRLLTYAMLVKYGFNVKVGRILNPTAVFCIDRERYYRALSWGDAHTRAGMLKWCEYVLSGLKDEMEKIDKLLNYGYLSDKILLPTIDFSLERQVITDLEAKILKVAVEKQVFVSSDIEFLMPQKVYTERSRVLGKLKDKKMIAPERGKSKKYILRFDNNYLLRGIIMALEKEGFVPIKN